jgi:hypothetical protein
MNMSGVAGAVDYAPEPSSCEGGTQIRSGMRDIAAVDVGGAGLR